VVTAVALVALGVLAGVAWKYKGAGFALVATLVAAAFYFAPERAAPPEIVTVVDTVPSVELLARVQALELDTASLRSRLRARETRQPETLTTGRDPIPAPEACTIGSAIDGRGRLTVAPIFAFPDSVGVVTQYLPEIRAGIDVSDCDDGVSIGADGTVVCDRPRLGHLDLVAVATLEYPLGPDAVTGYPGLGLSWTPTYRSPWSVDAFIDVRPDVAFSLRVQRSVFSLF